MESNRERAEFRCGGPDVVAEEEGITGCEALPIALEGTLEGI